MQSNNLIIAISALPRKKVTRFKEFAHSPYFNKHVDVANLVAYLSNIYPHFSEKKCNRETIFKCLYPTLPHDQQKLAIVFTYSTRLLEDFFRMEETIKNGSLQNDSFLTAQLREHELLFLLEKYMQEYSGGGEEMNRKTLGSRTPTSDDLLQLSERDASAMRLANFDNHFLEKKQQLLDAYFLSEKLKGACELLQRSKLLNRKFAPTPLFDNAVRWICGTTEASLAYPSINLFLQLFTMLKTNETDMYDPLLAALVKEEPNLSQEESKAMFSHLQNFCIGQINAGKKAFLGKLFQIYRSQMDRELLLLNGYLPEWHYKNIVTTALRLDEHGWAKSFIQENKEKLRPEVRENAHSYNLAAYHSHLGHFDEVLQLLLQVEYTDLRYNLDAKSLLLRTYYEMEEEEALISLTDAFRQYLKRNREMTEYQKTGYYNLLKFTRRAFRLKMGKGFLNKVKWQSSYDKLVENLQGAETVFNLGWLQGKMKELVNDPIDKKSF